MSGFAEVISEWWYQSSHWPNLKWKLAALFSPANTDSSVHVLIKQTQHSLHLPPSDTSPVAPTCWWGLCREWKGADCPKLLLKWLTNHHEPQRLLENHQSIVNHPWFSLPWRSGYRLRWRVWACLCICYFGSRESAGRKGRNSGQR